MNSIRWGLIEIYFVEDSKEPLIEVWRFGYENVKDAEAMRSKVLKDFPDADPQNLQVIQYVI